MTKHTALFAVLVVSTFFIAGCGGSVLTGPSAVTGAPWKLQSIETLAGGLVGLSRPDNYTLEFADASRLSVKADCNTCSGTYSLSGASLSVGALACTKAFCGAASSDTAFLEVLSNATSIGVRGIELSIDSSRGTLRLTR